MDQQKQNNPDQNANQEPAEGSREQVRGENENRQERNEGVEQISDRADEEYVDIETDVDEDLRNTQGTE